MPALGVLHLDRHIAAGRDRLAGRLGRAQHRRVAAAQGERAALRHRIAGVDREVEHHLVELRRIDADAAARLLQREVQADAGAQGAAQHPADRGQRLVDPHGAWTQRLAAAERQQLPHQRRAAFRAAGDLRQLVARAGVGDVVEHLGGVEDRGEQVVEVVRDPAGELADRLQFLAVDELLLQVDLAGHVAQPQHHAGHRPVWLQHRAGVDRDGDLAPDVEPGARRCDRLAGERRLHRAPHRLAHVLGEQRRGGRAVRHVPPASRGFVGNEHRARRVRDDDAGDVIVHEQPCERLVHGLDQAALAHQRYR